WLSWTNVRLPGRPPEVRRLAGWRAFVTPGYFATVGIPLIAGRDFTEFDTDTAPRVAIVNERFARFYLGDVNVIGRDVHIGWEPGNSTRRIIGVVRDYVNGNPRELSKGLGFAYMPYRDRESKKRLSTMSVAIRTSGDPRLLKDRVRRELLTIDPSLPVLSVDTIDEQLDAVLAQDRLMAGVASFFGIVAMLLAALGLYGTIAYATARRTGEIGIRMALGATPSRVLMMILEEGLALVGVGLALGVLGATV